MSVTFYTKADPEGMNVSNNNYAAIMSLLGYEGVTGSEDFAGERLVELQRRIVFVLESLNAMPGLDDGKPAEEIAANWIDFGRRDGYFTDRLTQLLHVVNRAVEQGEEVYCA